MKIHSRFAVISLLFVSSPAFAVSGPFDGAYIGVQGGYDDYTSSGEFGGTMLGSTEANDVSSTHVNYGGFTGIGKTFGSIYLGLEGEGSVNDTKFNLTDSAGDALQIKDKYTYGADARLGFLPTQNIMLFGTLGGVRSQFEATSNASSGKDWINGIRYGLGTETQVGPHLVGSLGWTYTSYQSYNYADSATTASFKPDENLFRVGLAYIF